MDQKLKAEIRWAPLISFSPVKRLYVSYSKGIPDEELCNDVGIRLYLRCETFIFVWENKVKCPVCRTVFKVEREGISYCPNEKCDWFTDFNEYWASVKPAYAWGGRAIAAWKEYYEKYTGAKTFQEKIILIDQLIHSFHIDEKTNLPAKTVVSKLFEGKRKTIVQQLDELSGIDNSRKEQWRQEMLLSIDKSVIEKS